MIVLFIVSAVLTLLFLAASEVEAQAYGEVDVAAAAEVIAHIFRDGFLCQKRMLDSDVIFVQEGIEI